MVGKTNYTVKNSKQYVEKIRSCKLNDDECLVSYDMVSLFTKVPVNLALEVAEQKLCNDSASNDKTELSVSNMILTL